MGKYEELVEPRLEEITEWAKSGATNKEISAALGISLSTYDNYISKYYDFKRAVNDGRMAGVPKVKAALFKLATGYEYDESEITTTTCDGEITTSTKNIHKVRNPDLNACIIYLRNYDPEYRDKDAWERSMRERELKAKEDMAGFN